MNRRFGALALIFAAAPASLLSACGSPPVESRSGDTVATAIADDGRPPLPRICGDMDVPELTGAVVDQAELLSPADETRIDAQLADYRQATGHQAVVATLSSLHGKDDALVARCIGDAWRIGDARRNDGILILLAPNEKRVRVATGAAFGEREADYKAERVIDAMMPKLNGNDWAGGLSDGVRALGVFYP